jgi:hypothetical protein
MPINFPTSGLISNVTTYSFSGLTWIWTGSVWQSVGSVSVQGTQGIQGIQGAQSTIQGIQGLQGSTGTAGIGSAVAPITLTGSTVSFDPSYSNTFTANQTFSPTSSATVAVINKGAASQTANLVQNQNSTSTILSGINAAGQIYAGTTSSVVGSTTTTLTSAAYTSATIAVFTYGGTSLIQPGQTVVVAGVTGGTYNGTWTVSASTTTTFTVLGSGFTNVAGSGGTVKISAIGSFVASTNAITPLVVQAAASQTANIQEWQSSAGTALFYIDSAGTLRGGPLSITGINMSGFIVAANGTGSTLRFNQTTANTLNNAPVQIQSGTSAQLPLFIRASSGSTATITAATANGTTSVVYTAVASAFVVGQTVTITGVVSTGNTGATAGTGFNLTNALITAASATSFTATAPANLTDTYTSGGTATIQLTTNLPDIQQWQNPAGTALSKIDAAGNFTKGDGDQIVLASQIF